MAKQKEPTWITENKPLPKALRRLMSETNTTQPMLAKSIGVTRQTVSLYCTGQSAPDIETFDKIADYFDVTYDFLLGKSESKKRENVDIHKRTGLSDKAIEILSNWKYHTLSSDPSKNAFSKTPYELNKIIESEKLPQLIYQIRSLSYIENDLENENDTYKTLGRSKIEDLMDKSGYNAARDYIMYSIQNTFKEIINDIIPHNPIDES